MQRVSPDCRPKYPRMPETIKFFRIKTLQPIMNLLLQTKPRSLFATFATLIACCVVTAATHAATTDIGEMKVGVKYSFDQGDEIIATYTAPEAGPLKVVFSDYQVPVYIDENHTEPNYNYTFAYGPDSEKIQTYQVSAGEVLYFYSAPHTTISSGSMWIAEKPESINLVRISPSLDPESNEYFGGKMSVSTYYRMTFVFDGPVTATSATLRFADGTYSSVTMTSDNSSIETIFASELMDAYREGKVKEGDEVTIRIVGVRSADFDDIRYDGNGRLEASFPIAAKPIELISSSNLPTTGMPRMLSYYLPDDPDGIVTMTFDGDIDPSRIPSATLTYGNPEDPDIPLYIENLPVSVDGRSLMIDLTGKRRRPDDMTPGSASTGMSAGFSVSDIYSTDGQRAYTGSQSHYTGFPYAYPVSVIEYVVASDFTPVRNSSVKEGSEVEIWIMNGTKARFDSLTVSYVKDGTSQTRTISSGDLRVEPDPESESDLLVTFDMPGLDADEGSALTIELTDPLFADGLDHSADVRGTYIWSGSNAVDSVTADSLAGDVFSITGVKVLSGAADDDLESLPAGLYIFNGRKIAVK